MKAARPLAPAPAVLFALALSLSGCAGKAPVELVFFYMAPCYSCGDGVAQGNLLARLHALTVGGRFSLAAHEISDETGLEALDHAYDLRKIPPEGRALPALFAGDVLYAGEDQVAEAIARLEREAARGRGRSTERTR